MDFICSDRDHPQKMSKFQSEPCVIFTYITAFTLKYKNI